MYENMTKAQEAIQSTLEDSCPRCGKEGFIKKGSHDVPRLVCPTCGLTIKVTSKANILIDSALALCGILGVMGLIVTVAYLAWQIKQALSV